jgi:hypothetical protein
MPRKLVSGADYPTNYRGQVIRLAQVTAQVISTGLPVTHYFAAEETDYAAHHYLPWLVVDEAIQRYRSLQADSAVLKLQNIDGQLEVLLALERWEGALVRILDYFTGLGEGVTDAVELIRGLLNERQADERATTWDIVPLWDATAIAVPPRKFSRTCTLRYKSEQCGSSSGEPTCDKTRTACLVRGATGRFNGFLQINATLEEVYRPA